MTNPFTAVTPYDPEAAKADRLFIPIRRCRGILMIVRPLKYQSEGFITEHAPNGTDAVFADFAILDALAAAENEEGDKLPGFPAGQQFRDNSVLQRFLIGTFKRHIGDTLIGTIYFGPKTKGKPPIMWQDLATDPGCVARGQQFLATHPEFLVPVEAQIVQSTPEPEPAGPVAYVQPQQEVVSGAPRAASTLDAMRTMAQQGGGSYDQPPF